MSVKGVILMLVVIYVSSGVTDTSSPKPLTSLLRSSWGYTPFLLEASEFLWDYDTSIFWKFVNESTDLYSGSSTDQEVYEWTIGAVEKLLPPSVHNVFIFSLAVHSYSPAVQLFQQLSTEAYSKLSSSAAISCVDEDGVFMEVHGHYLCTVDTLQQLISEGVAQDRIAQVYQFDHQFPTTVGSDVPLVVLYGELGTPEFARLHSTLSEMAASERIQYVFRHYYKRWDSMKLQLSGYGVQLSVKSTEYKAVDDTEIEGGTAQVVTSEEDKKEVSGFIFSTLHSRYPKMTPHLEEFEAHLLQGAREMPELKLWQLQDLGFQAAQRVKAAGSDFGLKVLRDISQNLPTQAKSLYKVQVDKSVRKEIQANQKDLEALGVSPGDCVMLLNGIIIQKDALDIFQLLELLLSESRMLDSLNDLGIEPSAHAALIGMPVHRSESNQVVLDVRSKSVVFVNDLEKDRVYRSWAKSLREFLRPTYPGMLRQIARNVFNIVFMLDPLSASGVELVEYVKLFLDHMVPARLGLVLLPDPEDEVAVAVCRGFAYLSVQYSPKEGLRWLVKAQQLSVSQSNLTVGNLSDLFETIFSKSLDKVPVSEVFMEEWDEYRKEARKFFSAKGFASVPQVLVNGVPLDLKEEDLEMAIVSRMQHQTYSIQQAVFTNKLTDKDNVYDYFMGKPQVLQRMNRHVLAKSQVFDLSSPVVIGDGASWEEPVSVATLARSLKYLSQPESEFTIKELSVWVVVDLSTSQGRQMALDAINYSLSSQLVRVAIVHNTGEGCLLSRAVQAALSSHSSLEARVVGVQTLLSLPDSFQDSLFVDACNGTLDSEEMKRLLYSAETNSTITSQTHYSRTVLGLGAGQSALLSNGKLIGPLSEGEVFGEADWNMLYSMESDTYAADLVSVVGSLDLKHLSPDEDTSAYRSDLLMVVASLLRRQPKRNRLSHFPALSEEHSVVHLPPMDPDLYLTVIAILDPLSPDAQRIAPILQTLHAALSLDLTIYLNPVAKLSQLPASSFYRYVLQPELSFGENGSVKESAVAVFSDLPTSPLLTLSLDVPHSWLVEPVFSPYDLDNIHLAQVADGSVHAEFVLEHILVEGQCFDIGSEQPTPGLEFVLGSTTRPDLYDTIVMANLGYFQLKAAPGAFTLRLREGRSKDIYYIHSFSEGVSEKMAELEESGELSINVRSFAGTTVLLKVGKKPGMERVELLADETSADTDKKAYDSAPSGLWNTLSNLLHSPEEQEANQEETISAVNETINIFSIASGHLYERFLRIMMLSVLKHTHNPVKFWFLKNYLSPTFKEFIPHMAEHYGFEYELVEYKWPRWLHQQTQKQRLIWGYKILFLDVLFPLSVKKIIFVDADQIVRADLKELLEMPLDGAPYAYTPFCDSRPDMAGFRFWDKGYWRSHLGNRRYHISALYVVDLVVFRRMAAGDRLRGQYQALSQDPNSLANLDQDLPNNMIHSVPIKSLPQEWLWCETWCSLESKPQAKTIDLCNNPLTKEPKLDSAVRIVSEWSDYDSEIKFLWNLDGRAAHNTVHSHTEL